jgi:Zn finger protein HypA/HybF involved in hydrogenase expression
MPKKLICLSCETIFTDKATLDVSDRCPVCKGKSLIDPEIDKLVCPQCNQVFARSQLANGDFCPGCGGGNWKPYPEHLTRKQRREYVKEKYGHCPYCGSDDIEGGFIEVNDNYCWQPITCNNCEKEWNDLYTLTGIEEQE